MFIAEYLIDFNATQAAIRAGYSEKTAYNIGWENVNKREDIRAEIDKRIEERAMSADEVLIRLTDFGRGDLAHYILPDGELDLEALRADGMGHLLKKFKKGAKTTILKDGREMRSEWAEAELYDAQAALNTLAKIRGLTDKSPAGTEDDPVHVTMYIPDNGRNDSD